MDAERIRVRTSSLGRLNVRQLGGVKPRFAESWKLHAQSITQQRWRKLRLIAEQKKQYFVQLRRHAGKARVRPVQGLLANLRRSTSNARVRARVVPGGVANAPSQSIRSMSGNGLHRVARAKRA